MKLRVLGMSGAYPAANGACSGYLLMQGEHTLLMDCGSGVLSRLLSYTDPSDLSGIIITHWHFDHASDLLPLRYYLQFAGKVLDVYAPLTEAPLLDLCRCEQFRLHDLSQTKHIGVFKCEAMPTFHPMPNYAVRIMAGERMLVYTGDAANHTNLVDFCHPCDVLLCDAAFYHSQWHQKSPHMSAKMAGELALTTDHARLVLTHIPPFQDAVTLEKEATAVYPHCSTAYPGLLIEV